MQILCVIPHILPENQTKLQCLQMNMCYTSQFTSLSRVAKCKNILIIGLNIDVWSCNILHSLALNWWNGPGLAKKYALYKCPSFAAIYKKASWFHWRRKIIFSLWHFAFFYNGDTSQLVLSKNQPKQK